MKITHITEGWTGGISTYVKTLIENQSASDNYSRITLIYSANRTKSNLDDEFNGNSKIKLISYNSSRNPLKFMSIAKNISKLLDEENPDIVHLHSTFPGVYGRIFKKFKTIYCAHGWAFTQDISTAKKCIYGFIEKILALKTDAIINISRNELEAAHKHKIKCPVNIAILNGVAQKNDDSTHSLDNIDKTKINIGFIGRLDHQKGFDLIEPFFRENAPENITLHVIGEADRNSDKSFPKCDNIKYYGWVDNNLIDSYINSFDAVIMPSRYEGFGLVAVEAMRNSRAVIVSNRGALPELVIQGFNGYVFDLDNVDQELKNILSTATKESFKKMGENGQSAYFASFTSTRVFKEIENVYKAVINRVV